MSVNTYPRLLGDIGGTHARFAWQEGAASLPSRVSTYRCADHPNLSDAIGLYLREQRPARPVAAALGIANPVTGDEVRMTNHHWAFSISALQRELDLTELRVLNDFTALALSLPLLPPEALHPLGGGRARPNAPCALIGAGTGLGVSGLVPCADGGALALAGEGGHATLAAADDEESEVLSILRREFGHVSAERALSGPGLVNLYRASATLRHHAAEALSPAEVVSAARERGDPLCRAALDLFCRFLGGTAGSLALTLGAAGGVYIGGGIAPRLLPELRASAFRQRFEAKGRFAAYLSEIPCHVIDAPVSPALLGASRALDLPRC